MFGITKKHQEGDPRVAEALDALGIKYEIDAEGDYKFGFNLDEGRSQLGFIRSRTFEFAGVELREVYSAGLQSFGPFDARTANLLLAQNANVKIGAWEVGHNQDDQHFAVFTAKIAADLEGAALLAVIHAVLTTADQMEQRLAGRDDF